MNIQSIKELTDKEGIVFLAYTGFLSQSLISAMMASLEQEADYGGLNLGVSAHIYTIFIEMAQNMMNYSRDLTALDNARKPEGIILVGKRLPEYYYVESQNVVDVTDMEKMQPKLAELQDMNNDEIKKRYRELRKSGRDTHEVGGGIGFYEIAKRCERLEYSFSRAENNKYFFNLKAIVPIKKGD